MTRLRNKVEFKHLALTVCDASLCPPARLQSPHREFKAESTLAGVGMLHDDPAFVFMFHSSLQSVTILPPVTSQIYLPVASSSVRRALKDAYYLSSPTFS